MMVSEGTDIQQTYPRQQQRELHIENTSRWFDNVVGHWKRSSALKDFVRNLMLIFHLNTSFNRKIQNSRCSLYYMSSIKTFMCFTDPRKTSWHFCFLKNMLSSEQLSSCTNFNFKSNLCSLFEQENILPQFWFLLLIYKVTHSLELLTVND